MNELQLLPEYDADLTSFQMFDNLDKHYDADIDSVMLNVRLSMRWRPKIEDDTLRDLRQWTTAPYADMPTFILIGRRVNVYIQQICMVSNEGMNSRLQCTLHVDQ